MGVLGNKYPRPSREIEKDISQYGPRRPLDLPHRGCGDSAAAKERSLRAAYR
jgi:hypothetical protein